METLSSTSTIINQFLASQSYFSDILNAQLVIFSIIVGAIIALYFLFNYKISKDYIKNEVKNITDEVSNELKNENELRNKVFNEKLSQDMIDHESMIIGLRGEVYRTLGQFWDSEKSYDVAFIWWIRAAYNFFKANDEKLARISLNSAKKSLEKIKYYYQLTTDSIGEYQRLLSEIDDKNYKIEKDLLDKTIKEVMNRKEEVTK